MTCDSDRHAQRGDAKQAPSEGCQSGGATSAASPNLGRGKEDTVEEYVARAICWAMSEETDDCSSVCMRAGTCMAETVDDCFKRDARAAIKAMSEVRPQSTVTEEMIEAGMEAFGNTELVGHAFTRRAMRAAITAALSKVSPLVPE